MLAEFGARSIYGCLSKRMRDAELRQVIVEFHEEESQIIAKVQRLLALCGARSVPSRSRRRAFMSWVLALSSRGRADSLALRSCHDAELTVARWYSEYARYLGQVGARAEARTCEELAQTKIRHARILEAWMSRRA
ncbi:MAG: hypothetical protein JNL28_11480 [Planctomycetes bacterium]|nr:hypothetical protein [Planctomycetota bacterium]